MVDRDRKRIAKHRRERGEMRRGYPPPYMTHDEYTLIKYILYTTRRYSRVGETKIYRRGYSSDLHNPGSGLTYFIVAKNPSPWKKGLKKFGNPHMIVPSVCRPAMDVVNITGWVRRSMLALTGDPPPVIEKMGDEEWYAHLQAFNARDPHTVNEIMWLQEHKTALERRYGIGSDEVDGLFVRYPQDWSNKYFPCDSTISPLALAQLQDKYGSDVRHPLTPDWEPLFNQIMSDLAFSLRNEYMNLLGKMNRKGSYAFGWDTVREMERYAEHSA